MRQNTQIKSYKRTCILLLVSSIEREVVPRLSHNRIPLLILESINPIRQHLLLRLRQIPNLPTINIRRLEAHLGKRSTHVLPRELEVRPPFPVELDAAERAVENEVAAADVDWRDFCGGGGGGAFGGGSGACALDCALSLACCAAAYMPG